MSKGNPCFFILLALTLPTSFHSCNNDSNNSRQKLQEHFYSERLTSDKIEIRTYRNDSLISGSKGWGYDIYINGTKYIHQPHMPAINGEEGFKSKEDAVKTAELIARKINNNMMPPSISVNELDSLGVSR